jgi:predicted GIY-YIG superfamily endonuclease
MESRQDVFVRERQIKGWNRKKKEALMKGDWKEISWLAKGGILRRVQDDAAGLP